MQLTLSSLNSYFQGSTLKDLKHHMALQPLFLIMGAGMAMVALYIGRLALKTTDVQWTKNPEGFNAYKGKQFKFLNPLGVPYAETGKHIPDYRNVEEK